MKMDILFLKNELKDVPLPNIDDFKDASIEKYIDNGILAGNRLNKILRIVPALDPEWDIQKNLQGIILGHIVRLAKIYDSFLLLISQNHSEAAMLIARASVETSIHLKYLCDNLNDALCDKFIKSSLAYDKKLHEYVTSKINGKKPKDFEIRILESIKSNFDKTKFKIEDINFKTDSKWHIDLLSLSASIGMIDVYEVMYRILSRAEHGSWHHLENYNLKDAGALYQPQAFYIQPDPQLIFGTSLLCAEAAINYIKHIKVNDEMLNQSIMEIIKWYVDAEVLYINYKDKIYKD